MDINMTVTYIMRVSRAHCASQSWIIITRDRSTSAVVEASINVIKVTLLPTVPLPDDYRYRYLPVNRFGYYQTTLRAANYRFADYYRRSYCILCVLRCSRLQICRGPIDGKGNLAANHRDKYFAKWDCWTVIQSRIYRSNRKYFDFRKLQREKYFIELLNSNRDLLFTDRLLSFNF